MSKRGCFSEQWPWLFFQLAVPLHACLWLGLPQNNEDTLKSQGKIRMEDRSEVKNWNWPPSRVHIIQAAKLRVHCRAPLWHAPGSTLGWICALCDWLAPSGDRVLHCVPQLPSEVFFGHYFALSQFTPAWSVIKQGPIYIGPLNGPLCQKEGGLLVNWHVIINFGCFNVGFLWPFWV